MSDPLLSSLCTICGIRDPAAYVKRSDLATPAGIDRDYNYLTSIEREFDRAEKEAISRGVLLEPEKKFLGPMKGEANLEAAIERTRVIVMRAPKGMSRNKVNETRWTKGSQSIQWTVEWVHPDGRKELGQCHDNKPIFEAYRSLDGAPKFLRCKKRKRTHRGQDEGMERKKALKKGQGHGIQADSRPVVNGDVQAHGRGEDRSVSKEDEETSRDLESTSETIKAETSADSGEKQEPMESKNTTGINEHASAPQIPPQHNISFYLHTPSLPSRHPVLAPLSYDTRLCIALKDRLVLEFPTVFVFEQAPEEKLPEGYISEDEYRKMARKEMIEEVDEGEIIQGAYNATEDQPRGVSRVKKVAEGELVEVLGKDLAKR
ncbi:MAG: hypothetical protein Q9163_000297 [Psora crenata]